MKPQDLLTALVELIAEKVVEKMGGSGEKVTPRASKEPEEDDVDYDDLREELAEVANAFKKDNSAAELKKVLAEFDAKTIKSVADEDLEDVIKALTDEGDDEGDDEDEEVTVEAVKLACQAFAKKNGKDELDEILEDYEIKSVRSLNKLEQEDLEELFAEVTEE